MKEIPGIAINKDISPFSPMKLSLWGFAMGIGILELTGGLVMWVQRGGWGESCVVGLMQVGWLYSILTSREKTAKIRGEWIQALFDTTSRYQRQLDAFAKQNEYIVDLWEAKTLEVSVWQARYKALLESTVKSRELALSPLICNVKIDGDQLAELKRLFAEGGRQPIQVLDLNPQPEKNFARQIAVDFFYWWYNSPHGSNTEEGFDEWWENVREAE